MNKLIDSFKNKKFRYGAFSTLLAVFVIAILAVINLVVGQFDVKYDLTVTQMYSITNTSIDMVRELNEDVTIYALFRTGQENTQFKELLEQYAYYSNRVSVVYKDPFLYPQFVDGYKVNEEDEIPLNSVIVESARRFKVVPAADMVTYEFNFETFQQDLKTIDIEPQVTNAIKYVTEEVTPVVYVITGHNESAIDEAFAKRLMLGNYDFKELNLLYEEMVPEDASVVFISTPVRDWAPDEADKMLNYLNGGGNAMIILDPGLTELTNVRRVLAQFGVDLTMSLIYEGNPRNILMGMPYYMLPNQISHAITDPIRRLGYPNLLVMSTGIERLPDAMRSTTIETLLTTSDLSYAKLNPTADSMNKEPGDEDGPFEIAVAITDSRYTDKQIYARIVLVGSSSIMEPSLNSYVMGANADFVINSINWLAGGQSSVYVRSKTPSTGLSYLMIDGFQGLVLTLASMVFIPLAIIGAGVVVWLRRRNR